MGGGSRTKVVAYMLRALVPTMKAVAAMRRMLWNCMLELRIFKRGSSRVTRVRMTFKSWVFLAEGGEQVNGGRSSGHFILKTNLGSVTAHVTMHGPKLTVSSPRRSWYARVDLSHGLISKRCHLAWFLSAAAGNQTLKSPQKRIFTHFT